MSDMDIVADLLGGSRPVYYHAAYAHITGSVAAGVMLAKFWFWTNNDASVERDGWFWKTAEEIYDELGMKRYESDQARECLRGLGLLEEQRKGLPAKCWFRVDKTVLYGLLREYAKNKAPKASANKIAEGLQTGSAKVCKQESPQSANKKAERMQSTTKRLSKQPQKDIQQPPPPASPLPPVPPDVVDVSLVSDLVAVGITSSEAERLSRHFPEDRIRKHLSASHWQDTKNPPGALVTAIREDWPIKPQRPRPNRPRRTESLRPLEPGVKPPDLKAFLKKPERKSEAP